MISSGKFRIWPVNAGEFALDGGAMFGVVPKPLWEKTNPADARNRITMAARSLLLAVDDRLFLIDTGLGDKYPPKDRDIYRIDHRFDIRRSLQSLAIAPDQVTDIILTHLHFDHAGGTTFRDEEQQLQLTFPQARHYLQKKHYEWAYRPSERDKASFVLDDFRLLEQNDILKLLDGESEIYPGISTLPCFGHTSAMQLVKISTGVHTFLYCADLIPMSAHIPLPYIMGYDLNPLNTLDEKKRLLSQVAEERWILVFQHDPYLAACYVDEKNGRFVKGESFSLGEEAAAPAMKP